MISPFLTRIPKHKKQYDHINQAISQNEIKEKLWQIYTQNTNKNTNKLNASIIIENKKINDITTITAQ